jgi:hypothetical protein
MPSANTSERASMSRPRHCCGDMYANLPFTTPASVLVEADVAFAMPKSSSFTCPFAPTKMFAGFRSR